jgi:hypothetical protein
MRASTIADDDLLHDHRFVFDTCAVLLWYSISLCALQDNAPDAADVVLSFDELHLTESPTIETVPQRHKSAGSSADDEHSLRLDGHRSDYNNMIINPVQKWS